MSSLLALRDLVHRSGGQCLVPTPDPEGGEVGHIHPEAVVPGVLVIEVEGLTFQLEGDEKVLIEPGPDRVGLQLVVVARVEQRAPDDEPGAPDPGRRLQGSDQDGHDGSPVGVGSPCAEDLGEVGPRGPGGQLPPRGGRDRLGPRLEDGVSHDFRLWGHFDVSESVNESP